MATALAGTKSEALELLETSGITVVDLNYECLVGKMRLNLAGWAKSLAYVSNIAAMRVLSLARPWRSLPG